MADTDTQPEGLTSEELAKLLASAGVTELDLGGDADKKKPAKKDDKYAGGNAATGALRSLGQGVLLGFADEAMAGLRSMTGKETYAEAVKDEREKLKAFRKAHPVISTTAEIAGGFVTPGVGLVTGAIRPAATTLGRMAQGGMYGSGFGAIAGAGAGDEDRWGGAKHGAGLGLLIGPAMPLAGQAITRGVDMFADAAAPTLARMGARINRGRTGTPDEAAADAIMVQDLRSQNRTPAQVRQMFTDADDAARVHSSGQPADIPLMLADDPSLVRTAGSAARASRDAGARAEATMRVRQTGETPSDAQMARYADDAGLPHRNPLSEAAGDYELRMRQPAGQHERIIHSNLRKSFQLMDKQAHGFADNAYETEQALVKAMKKASDKNYGDARAAFQGYDLTPNVQTYMEALAAAAKTAPRSEATLIRNFARQFTTGEGGWVNTLDGVDQAKRQVDRIIEKMINAGDKTGVRQMNELKKAFLAQIDNIKDANGVEIGKLYAKAREFHYLESQKINAIEWGRKAGRGESNATAAEFDAFEPALKKFARLGLLEGMEMASADKRRANDLTQLFQTNRMQALLRKTIARTDNANGVFANRPERFGQQIGYEQTMVGTSNKVLGNSKTAERLSDDQRLTRQTLSQVFNQFRSGNIGLTQLGLEFFSAGLNRFFGMRESHATELGRRMFTADRAEIERIIQRLEARWGVDRVEAFANYMRHSTLGSAAATSNLIARTAAEGNERQRAQGMGLLQAR
jgi:hypothetical protein